MRLALARAKLRSQAEPIVGLACGPGCHHCCRTFLVVSMADVLLALWEIQRTHGHDELARLRTALKHADRRRRHGESPPMCPLLAGGRCSIYGQHPAVCAGRVSRDVSACRKLEEAVLLNDNTPVKMDFPLEGMEQAAAEMGQLNPLNARFHFWGALETLLRRPESAEWWSVNLGNLLGAIAQFAAKDEV